MKYDNNKSQTQKSQTSNKSNHGLAIPSLFTIRPWMAVVDIKITTLFDCALKKIKI